jgi:hypothetical protein
MMMDDEIQDDGTLETILSIVLSIVNEANAAGLMPEEVLDPEEMALWLSMQPPMDTDDVGHYDNLVDKLDSSELARLATDIINWVQYDERSRDEWSKREKRGIQALGVSDNSNIGASFEGASRVVHPLLAEAVVQFHSRALPEIFPSTGELVKAQILGDMTPELVAQSHRVEDYMNYQYTVDMAGAFEEIDKMLFRLPLSGSVFKKVDYCPLSKKCYARMIEPADFIVPFSANDLETAPRFTYRVLEMHNTVKKKIKAGYYAKQEKLTSPINEGYRYPVVKTEIDNTEGRAQSGVDDHQRHTILECYVDLDLEGFEDPDGIALPYIVTVNSDDQTVLRVQRNYAPDDDSSKRIMRFVHYRFMPGFGFYGYGLLHLIGGLADSASGALNALLDSAAFSNMQGGFRTEDSRVKDQPKPLAPGEWRSVNQSIEDLNKAFFTLPYKEPSAVLFSLLGYLGDIGNKFAGTTDTLTGDAAQANQAVGTTLALIEQGSTKFSAIHQRLHQAQSKEFTILAELNKYYLPEEGYPYHTKSGSKSIAASDFDDRIDIIPTSNPSAVTSTQRIVQAQAVLELAEKHPAIIEVKEAISRLFLAMRVPNYDELFSKDDTKAQAQQQAQQLEVEKVRADIDKTIADTAHTNGQTMFEIVQTAVQLMTNPAAVIISDSLLKSIGFKDANGTPIADVDPTQLPQQIDTGIPTNTSPQFPTPPPNSMPVAAEQPEIAQPQQMPSAMTGMETAAHEPIQ